MTTEPAAAPSAHGGLPRARGGPAQPADAIARVTGGRLAFGDRVVWTGLDLDVRPGEFLAILGANGSGKSSLLKVLLGQQDLSAGTVTVAGRPVGRGSRVIGLIPQRIAVDPIVPIVAADLVRLGVDGHRWGTGILRAKAGRRRALDMLAAVGAGHLAASPVAQLSGGEMQRVRVAEALAAGPRLLLADEPLAALDVAQSAHIVAVIDDYRRRSGAAVLFVTHDINTVLHLADRVLYFAGGGYRLGSPQQVLTSAALTGLYGAPVDVVHSGGRVVVAAASDPGAGLDLPHTGDEGRP